MVKWRHGDMEMETWIYGRMETWRHGDVEMLRHEDIERHGSPGDFPQSVYNLLIV
jgi:hypothetical protein